MKKQILNAFLNINKKVDAARDTATVEVSLVIHKENLELISKAFSVSAIEALILSGCMIGNVHRSVRMKVATIASNLQVETFDLMCYEADFENLLEKNYLTVLQAIEGREINFGIPFLNMELNVGDAFIAKLNSLPL